MKKKYFNIRWISLLSVVTFLISLFTFASPVYADTSKTNTESTKPKMYTQDFESYTVDDSITYTITSGNTGKEGTVGVAEFGENNSALKVVTQKGTGYDNMHLTLPGMKDVEQIEIFFKFRIDGTGRVKFDHFASTERTTKDHMRSVDAYTVGIYKDGAAQNHIKLPSDEWLYVRQVYNLKDNTFCVYKGEDYGTLWIPEYTLSNVDTWKTSLTGNTIDLWFVTHCANSQNTGNMTYYIDDVKIVGSTLPDEILYNEAGTAPHIGDIDGGDTVKVKIAEKTAFSDYAGFAALKNSVTKELADVKCFTQSNKDNVILTAPDGDGKYIVDIYYFNSINDLKPLCEKTTLPNN